MLLTKSSKNTTAPVAHYACLLQLSALFSITNILSAFCVRLSWCTTVIIANDVLYGYILPIWHIK